jgi:hypothetical protein
MCMLCKECRENSSCLRVSRREWNVRLAVMGMDVANGERGENRSCMQFMIPIFCNRNTKHS